MPTDDVSQVGSSVWIPQCCEHVMRHNVFRSGDKVIAAALVCTVCGKNVALTLHEEGSLDDFGAGVQVLPVLAVAKPLRQRANVQSPAGSDTETLG